MSDGKEDRIIHRTRMLSPTAAPPPSPKKHNDYTEPPAWRNEMSEKQDENEACILL